MREIKFRAWDRKEKKLTYMDELNMCFALENHNGNEDENYIILEQYTGLKDSTGKEVYAGDKFKIIHAMYIVCFNEGKFYLEIEDMQKMGYAKILDIVNCKDFEITGNIHE